MSNKWEQTLHKQPTDPTNILELKLLYVIPPEKLYNPDKLVISNVGFDKYNSQDTTSLGDAAEGHVIDIL